MAKKKKNFCNLKHLPTYILLLTKKILNYVNQGKATMIKGGLNIRSLLKSIFVVQEDSLRLSFFLLFGKID